MSETESHELGADHHAEGVINLAQRNGLLKLGFIVTAFLEAFVLGLIPVKSKVFRESPKVLGIANAFSGGVFLAIALMHILPE